jgi:hypothetical protein
MAKKYDRKIWDKYEDRHAVVDVYRVLDAFNVTCPATAHAVKKLLCAGIRGHKDMEQDLAEAAQSIEEARAMAKQRRRAGETQAKTQTKACLFNAGDQVRCLNGGSFADVSGNGSYERVNAGEIGNVIEEKNHYIAVRFYNPFRWVLMRSIDIEKAMEGGATNGQ